MQISSSAIIAIEQQKMHGLTLIFLSLKVMLHNAFNDTHVHYHLRLWIWFRTIRECEIENEVLHWIKNDSFGKPNRLDDLTITMMKLLLKRNMIIEVPCLVLIPDDRCVYSKMWHIVA